MIIFACILPDSLLYCRTAWVCVCRYNEYSQYNYNYPGFSEATGHFTQVVWKATTQLGCAVKVCGSGFAGWSTGGTYVVCR